MTQDVARADAAELLAQAGDLLWSAVLVGNPAPYVEGLRQRMKTPQKGDLVVELTTRHRPFDGSRIGYLQRRWMSKRLGEVFDIVGLDGKQTRWSNAWVVAIPVGYR